MSAATTEIANLALSHIGARRLTELDTDTTVEAQTCRLHYTRVRDALLRRMPWNFATKRVAVVYSAAPISDWVSSWTLPADCVRVLRVSLDDTIANERDFTVEGRKLLTNHASNATVEIVYISNTAATTDYDALFFDSFSYLLAAAIALDITDNAGLADSCLAKYKALGLEDAIMADAKESFAGLHYANVRDSLLRRFPWAFATKRAAVVYSSAPIADWGSSWTLPADCVRVLRVSSDDPATPERDYTVEGRKLLCNRLSNSVVEIVYISNTVLPSDWDPLFAEAHRYLLDAAVAHELGDSAAESAAYQKYEALALKDAVIANAREALAGIHYAHTRDALLRRHPWNFATKRVAISRWGTDPVSDWVSAWILPTDCVRLLRVSTDDPDAPETDFAIEGRYLLLNTDEDADSGDVKVVYISNTVPAIDWDPLFVEAFTCLLDAAVAYDLQDNSAAAAAIGKYKAMNFRDAINADAKETLSAENHGPRKLLAQSSLVAARYR
jgi:hypothetical protein